MTKFALTFAFGLILTCALGQKTILFKPFVDDHIVFTSENKCIGFMRTDKYSIAENNLINYFNNKTITVTDFLNGLNLNSLDTVTQTILKHKFRLSVDSVIQATSVDTRIQYSLFLNNVFSEDSTMEAYQMEFLLTFILDKKTNFKFGDIIHIRTKKWDK